MKLAPQGLKSKMKKNYSGKKQKENNLTDLIFFNPNSYKKFLNFLIQYD